MTKKEVWNLKGERISESDDEKWYQLSGSTYLLILGLILFNIGCFLNPALIDSIFRLLDIRLWPWWYFLFAMLLIFFSIKWFFIKWNWLDNDESERDEAIRFLRMSITITIVFFVLVFLNASNLMIFLSNPLKRWLGIGVFSWNGFLAFVLLAIATIPTIYFAKEWIIAFLGNRQ